MFEHHNKTLCLTEPLSRRGLLAGAALSASGVSVSCDVPVTVLVERWRQAWAVADAAPVADGPADDAWEHRMAQVDALEEQILTTPADTVDGVRAKLAVALELVTRNGEDYHADFIRSAMADLAALA